MATAESYRGPWLKKGRHPLQYELLGLFFGTLPQHAFAVVGEEAGLMRSILLVVEYRLAAYAIGRPWNCGQALAADRLLAKEASSVRAILNSL